MLLGSHVGSASTFFAAFATRALLLKKYCLRSSAARRINAIVAVAIVAGPAAGQDVYSGRLFQAPQLQRLLLLLLVVVVVVVVVWLPFPSSSPVTDDPNGGVATGPAP